MMRRRYRTGLSFSWRRASGLSASKARLSRQLGIPLTRSGRRNKAGRALSRSGSIVIFLIVAYLLTRFTK